MTPFCHITFYNQRCPQCGRDLTESNYCQSGHLRCKIGKIETMLFAACSEHFADAPYYVTPSTNLPEAGEIGEWSPELGLVARVTVGEKTKTVVLIEGHLR